MQDFLLKYGLLLVAVALALAMAFFSFKALNISDDPAASEYTFRGDGLAVGARIIELCDSCRGQDRECAILRIQQTDQAPIGPLTAPFPIIEEGPLDGAQAVRIRAEQGACLVVPLE